MDPEIKLLNQKVQYLKGYALMIDEHNGHQMFGRSKKEGQWFQNKEAFTSIDFFSKKGKLLWEQQMNKE